MYEEFPMEQKELKAQWVKVLGSIKGKEGQDLLVLLPVEEKEASRAEKYKDIAEAIGIMCGEGANASLVTLTARFEVLAKFQSKHPAIFDIPIDQLQSEGPLFVYNGGKDGEALVKEAIAAGGILVVNRHKLVQNTGDTFKDQLRHNGPNGEPAIQWFHENGVQQQVCYYQDNQLHDGPNGIAAEQLFDKDGKLTQAKHFKNGKLNDGDNGEAAVTKYENGKLVYAARYKDGKLVKELEGRELAFYPDKPPSRFKIPGLG
jgi:hypothetical protein